MLTILFSKHITIKLTYYEFSMDYLPFIKKNRTMSKKNRTDLTNFYFLLSVEINILFFKDRS
jgi:hypothetical protein